MAKSKGKSKYYNKHLTKGQRVRIESGLKQRYPEAAEDIVVK